MTAKDLNFHLDTFKKITFQRLMKTVFYWRLCTDIDDSPCTVLSSWYTVTIEQ
jgi:hypothetical protein